MALKPWYQLIPIALLGIFVTVFYTLTYTVFELITKGPRRLFYYKRRDVPPKVLTDPKWGTSEFFSLPGRNVTIHCMVNGSRDKPLMLFLHGFPDFWYSFRYQLVEFGKDYCAVAMDLRGYGKSSRPPKSEDYIFDQMVDDIDQVITCLGYNKVSVLVGQDWGAILSNTYCAMHPDRVERQVIMDGPDIRAFDRLMLTSPRQAQLVWFLFVFLIPYLGPFLVLTDDMSNIVYALTNKTKGAKPGTYTEEDLEAIKYTFNNYEGYNTALSLQRGYLYFQTPRVYKALRAAGKVRVKSLIIWGTRDMFFTPPLAKMTAEYIEDARVEFIEGSHWIQVEEPQQVNKAIRRFIADLKR